MYVKVPVELHADSPMPDVAVKVMVWVGLLSVKADFGQVTVTSSAVVVLDGADGKQKEQQTSVRYWSIFVD